MEANSIGLRGLVWPRLRSDPMRLSYDGSIIDETRTPTWSDDETASERLTSALEFENFSWHGKLAAMPTNVSMPAPFRDEFLRKESSLGEPVRDYIEHILRCALMTQAIEGYDCTEPEIAAARRVIQTSETI